MVSTPYKDIDEVLLSFHFLLSGSLVIIEVSNNNIRHHETRRKETLQPRENIRSRKTRKRNEIG